MYLDGVCFKKLKKTDHFEEQSLHGDNIKINLKRTRMGKRRLALLGSGKGQETEICTLLVYYAAYSGNSLPTFRDNLSLPSSTVKTQGISFFTHEDEADRLYRNVGKVLTTTRCAIYQVSADLVYFVAEAVGDGLFCTL